MAIRNIFKEGDSVLRKKSRAVTAFDSRLAELLDDMKETMHVSDGVGLAAPQVGILRRAVVIEFEDEYYELINPVISNEQGEELGTEGCLSVDSDKNCQVMRPYQLTCNAFDRNGQPISIDAEGWLARIICHEIDHLNGILFIDKKYIAPKTEAGENGKGDVASKDIASTSIDTSLQAE